jgi:PBP1b-binding outer membrane lipoprotein LpoB
MKSVPIFIFAAVALAACSEDKPPPKVEVAQPPQKTVFDTQLKALQKAKDVQKTVDQQKADQDKKLEEAGG